MNHIYHDIIKRIAELKTEREKTIAAANAGRDAAQAAADKAAAKMLTCMRENNADGYAAAKAEKQKHEDRIEAYTATLQAYTSHARCLCSAEESDRTMTAIKAEYNKNLTAYNSRVIEIFAELEQLNAAALDNLKEALDVAERWTADIDTGKKVPWYEITTTQGKIFQLLGSTSVREDLGLAPYNDPRSNA